MIHEQGFCTCDFCKADTGYFNFDTGNHVTCEENAALRKRIAELDAENITMYGAIMEAAEMGSVRCQLELRRIARKDAGLDNTPASIGWQKNHEYHGPSQPQQQMVGAHIGIPALSRTEAAHAPHGYAPTTYAQKQIDAANKGKQNERDGKR
jgi:hypothetical protein